MNSNQMQIRNIACVAILLACDLLCGEDRPH